MKKPKSKKEMNNSSEMNQGKRNLLIPVLSIDGEIDKIKSEIANSKDERWRECQKSMLEYIVLERELRIKTAKAIIKVALKRTTKFIKDFYPRIINEPEERRYHQLRTNRKHYSEEIINAIGSSEKFISCTCNDGLVRIFEIKIEAFIGTSNHGRKGHQCVSVYLSLRNHYESKNQIPVKYSVN